MSRNPRPPLAPRKGAVPPPPEDPADWLAERLRRGALAGLSALLVARAYWPSEANDEAESGVGLSWVFALLGVAILALVGPVLAGKLRLRWTWADAAVVGLFLCVGLATSHAADRRTAINLSWQWGAVGIAYILLRWLPRDRRESSAIAGALAASAVGVALYALYQVYVEFPDLHARYLRDPVPMLRAAGVPAEPGNPLRVQFENRLLRSNEPYSTFALANTLAGYLVGPLVLGIAAGLSFFRPADRQKRGSWLGLVAGLIPLGLLAYCLLLTKSRSAYLGLLVGLAILAWGYRKAVPRGVLIGLGALGLVAAGVVVTTLMASGRLDRQVLTESTKSFRYRLEYWQGTWGVLADEQTWWRGLGPGNFRGPYLRHKLIESSEEIADPHNFLLETWVVAGLPGLLCLLATLGLAAWNLLGRPRSEPVDTGLGSGEAPPPRGSGWLVALAGLGGWFLVVALGHLNIFAADNADLIRWFLLGAGWLMAVLLGGYAWKRAEWGGFVFVAAGGALAVHLLAAGALGYPAIAGSLLGIMALGLNLRDDRPCGRRFEAPGGRLGAFVAAVVLTALIGTFAGAISPYWRARSEMLAADEMLARRALRPEDYREVVDRLSRAAKLDAYGTRPWIALAELEYQAWLARGSSFDDRVWNRIEPTLAQARQRPRNPDSLEVRRRRADYANRFLGMPGLPEGSRRQLLLVRADALYTLAVDLNPTSAPLRAQAAEALGAAGDHPRAVAQARIAIDLDRRTPHDDRRLKPEQRDRLTRWIARGEKPPEGPAAGAPPPAAPTGN